MSTQDLDLRRQLQDLIIRVRQYGIDYQFNFFVPPKSATDSPRESEPSRDRIEPEPARDPPIEPETTGAIQDQHTTGLDD